MRRVRRYPSKPSSGAHRGPTTSRRAAPEDTETRAQRIAAELLAEEEEAGAAAKAEGDGSRGKRRTRRPGGVNADARGSLGSRTAVQAALDRVGELDLSSGQSSEPDPLLVARKAWWTELAQAARLHLSLKVQGRPLDAMMWESSVRACDADALAAFQAVQELIKQLVEPCIGDGRYLPTPTRAALLAALSRGLTTPKTTSSASKRVTWLRVLCVSMMGGVKEAYTFAVVMAFLRANDMPLTATDLLTEDAETDEDAVTWRAELLTFVKGAWEGANGQSRGALDASAKEMESIETAILTVQRQVASGNLPDSYAVEAGSGVVRAGPETRSAPSRPTSAPSQAPASDTRRAEPGTRRDAPPTGSRPTTPARAPATPAPAPPARTPVAAEPRVYPPTSTAVLGEVLPPPRAGGAGDPWAAVTEARSLLALGAGADLKALSRAKRRVALRLARADQGAVGADAVAALRAMQAQLTGAISRTQLQSIVGASGTHAPVAAVWQLAPTQGPASDGASPLAPAYASISGQEEEDDDLTCIVCMDDERSVTFMPCGHQICCLDCVKKCRKTKGECPKCSRKIERVADEEGFLDEWQWRRS